MSPDCVSDQFQDWLARMHGWNLNETMKSTIKPFIFDNTGRGLQAVCDISPGEVLLQIPSSLIITPKRALQSLLTCTCAFEKEHSAVSHLSGVDVIAIFLLHEYILDTESVWHPFLSDYLPDTFGNYLYFTPEELLVLPQHLKLHARKQIDSFQRIFSTVQPWLADFMTTHSVVGKRDQFPVDQLLPYFRRFWSAVNSRCVYCKVPSDLNSDTCNLLTSQVDIAVVPIFDLFNHSEDADAEVMFDPDLMCLQLKTKMFHSKMDQVFINYGNHSNATLLAEYGFTLKANQNDCVYLTPCNLAEFTTEASSNDADTIDNKTVEIVDYLNHLTCYSIGKKCDEYQSLFISETGPSLYLCLLLDLVQHPPSSFPIVVDWEGVEERQSLTVVQLASWMLSRAGGDLQRMRACGILSSRLEHVLVITKRRIEILELCIGLLKQTNS